MTKYTITLTKEQLQTLKEIVKYEIGRYVQDSEDKQDLEQVMRKLDALQALFDGRRQADVIEFKRDEDE